MVTVRETWKLYGRRERLNRELEILHRKGLLARYGMKSFMARRYGVTRQRIHQICQELNLK